MKKFTKVALIFAVIFFILGFACIIGSIATGLTWGTFSDMVHEGRFSFSIGKVHLGGFVSDDRGLVDGDFDNLDIELGAGTLEVYYDDVDSVQVGQEGTPNFKYYVEDDTLYISSSSRWGISDGLGSVTVIIPNGMSFDEADLEIGAGEATVDGLQARELSVSVGAGSAQITGLDVHQLDVQTGTGELYIELVGSEEDYNYDLECGIGEIAFENFSMGGLGSEQNINNPGADRYLDLECGIGRIQVEFEE